MWQKIMDFLNKRGWQEIRESGTLHLFGSFVLVIVLHKFAGTGAIMNFSLVLGVGLAKELYDKLRGSGWSWIDLGLDLLGIGFGVLFTSTS